MRATTVADMKKRTDLVASVTNILSVIAKPALVSWLCEQSILAALTLPRGVDETLDAFAHRVVSDSREQVSQAADLGTQIHDAAENYLRSGVFNGSPSIQELFQPVKTWLDANVEEVLELETVVVNPEERYAGRVDIIASFKGVGFCVADLKTQKIRNGKAAFYDTFPLQLSAYLMAQKRPAVKGLISIVINSVEPSPVQTKVWENHEQYWRAFLAAKTLWNYTKGIA